MSAGVFVNSKYGSTETTQVHPIRVQPETLLAAIGAVANTAPTAAIDLNISAQVTRSTRSLGLHARKVNAKLIGDPPEGYSSISKISIPALTETFYNAAVKGAVMVYLDTNWEIVGRRPEVAR